MKKKYKFLIGVVIWTAVSVETVSVIPPKCVDVLSTKEIENHFFTPIYYSSDMLAVCLVTGF